MFAVLCLLPVTNYSQDTKVIGPGKSLSGTASFSYYCFTSSMWVMVTQTDIDSF